VGPDPTLVLLPGWCGPRSLFNPLQERLGGVLRAVALDWRGHGESKPAEVDFGSAELVEDALAVIDHCGAERVVPVAVSHAGWVAIELRRRLGPARVPGVVLIDWMVLGAPPPFLDALAAMAAPATTRGVVDQLGARWAADLDLPPLTAYVAEMTSYPDEMWARAAREINESFERFGSPLDAIAALHPPPRTLHLYAQPDDPGYLEGQRGFAAAHPWFNVEHLDATSHFPMFEVAETMADRIAEFARS
jgi:pimeloyl-ACP methyl ester carboxylesterase